MTTYDDGMAVRRAVLGDAHVDGAVAGTTEFTVVGRGRRDLTDVG